MDLVYTVTHGDIYLRRIPGLKTHEAENRGLSVTQTRLGSFPGLSEFNIHPDPGQHHGPRQREGKQEISI